LAQPLKKPVWPAMTPVAAQARAAAITNFIILRFGGGAFWFDASADEKGEEELCITDALRLKLTSFICGCRIGRDN
jgi:hypothetical protein